MSWRNELIRSRVADAAFEAIRQAELELPCDYLAALRNARSLESSDVAQREYENIFEDTFQRIAKHFAQWQKERMMKDAIDTRIRT